VLVRFEANGELDASNQKPHDDQVLHMNVPSHVDRRLAFKRALDALTSPAHVKKWADISPAVPASGIVVTAAERSALIPAPTLPRSTSAGDYAEEEKGGEDIGTWAKDQSPSPSGPDQSIAGDTDPVWTRVPDLSTSPNAVQLVVQQQRQIVQLQEQVARLQAHVAELCKPSPRVVSAAVAGVAASAAVSEDDEEDIAEIEKKYLG
jgi:hypothetical protein